MLNEGHYINICISSALKSSSIFSTERAHPNFSNMKVVLTSSARMVWSQHSLLLCATLAALCKHQTKKLPVEEIITLIKSILPKNRMQSYDQSYLQSDLIFVQQSKQCFLAEFMALHKNNSGFITLSQNEINEVLKGFIEALVDADAINSFPTGNLDVMGSIGGIKIKTREQKIIQKLFHRLETSSLPNDEVKNNIEKECLRGNGHHSVSYQGKYMAATLWTFSKHFGIVLTNQHNVENVYHKIGLALQQEICDDAIVGGLYDDLLDSLPLLSLERQCFKRFVKALGIYNAICECVLENPTLKPLQSDLVCVIIKQMLQNLDSIVTGVEYQYKCNRKSYEYAKSITLQHAYTQLFVSFVTWIIKEVSFSRLDCKELVEYLYRQLLLPSLKGSFHDVPRASVIQYDRIPSILLNLSKDNLFSFKQEMFYAIGTRIKDLVLYAASLVNSQTRNTMFYEIMDAALFSRYNKLDIQILPALIGGMEHTDLEKNSTLFVAFNLSSSFNSLQNLKNPDSHGIELHAIRQFRKFAIKKFMLPKLEHKDDEVKLLILEQLVQLLNARYLSDRCDRDCDFSIGIATRNQAYLDFSDDVCYIIQRLSVYILKFLSRNSFKLVTHVYQCLHKLLSFQLEDGRNITVLCRTNSNDDVATRYFTTEIHFLFHLSCFIVNNCENHNDKVEMKEKFISSFEERQRILFGNTSTSSFYDCHQHESNTDAMIFQRILTEDYTSLHQSVRTATYINDFISSLKDIIM